MNTATEAVMCDHCCEDTDDLRGCQHYAICPDCIDGFECRICRRINQDETEAA